MRVRVHHHVMRLAPAHPAAIEARYPPRTEPFARDLLGEAVGIGRRDDGLGGEHAGRVVVPVTVARRPVKPRHDHHRAIEADHADDVFEHGLAVPAAKRLLDRLGVAVVDGGREIEVVEAVIAARQDQFAGADQAQSVEELGADRVRAAFAPVEAEQGRAGTPAAAGQREHAGVLVVGVGDDVQNAGRGGELADPMPGARRAAVGLQDLAGDRRRKGESAVEGGGAGLRAGRGGGQASDGQQRGGGRHRTRRTRSGRDRLGPRRVRGRHPHHPQPIPAERASDPLGDRPEGARAGGRSPVRRGRGS